MSQCLNLDCLAINPDHHKFCQKCGKSLLLKDRYQALRLIGQGGFGKTFLAIDHDKPSKSRCVIKQFCPQVEEANSLVKAEALFFQEAQRLEELGHHDQIPALMAYFTLESQQYLVQEYVEGQNLEEELKKEGIFNQQKIIEFLLDLLPVLDFIHRISVIHRDIKPENIIRRASDKKLVLVDFGAARVTQTNRSVTGTIIGSAEYVAPEQLNGKAVLASDLYSLGVTCLYLLTGVSPFELFDSGEFEWIWRDFLVDNLVDKELGIILDKLVTPGIKKRYQSVKSALKNVQELSISTKSYNQNSNIIIQASIFGGTTISNKKAFVIKEFSEKITKKSLLGSLSFDLKLVNLPSGELTMGSKYYPEEIPEHIVKLKSFAISQYPITQEQYKIVTGQSPSYFKQKPLNPIETVNWFEATSFCEKISELTGKKYRLPTEAEWEYACRAGNQMEYSFGNDEKYLSYYGWYNRNSGSFLSSVGLKKPNSWMLYDMHGGVWEWCADEWNISYAAKPQKLMDNGNIPWKSMRITQNTLMILRGGSWLSLASYCRSSSRHKRVASLRSNGIGFRVVLSIT